MLNKTTRKTPNEKKLLKRLAEGGKLRVYKIHREKSRCIICATAIVDPDLRAQGKSGQAIVLESDPSIERRMDTPEETNGTPLQIQVWLQDTENKKLIGPCGSTCGPEAVMAAWVKEHRNRVRQELLAAGVPAAEVEERIWQVAQQQWRDMMKVYRAAERDAKKLGINITTMTFDEIVDAVNQEKAKRSYKILLDRAQRTGLSVTETTGVNQHGWPIYLVNNTQCSCSADVRAAISDHHATQQTQRQQAAFQTRSANRARYTDHADFIDWILETTDRGEVNAGAITYWARDNLKDALMYIETGKPYQTTLVTVEQMAGKAKSWSSPYEPWTGRLGQVVVVQAGQPGLQLPKCPEPGCGGELVHKTGTSKYGNRAYDFYGCEHWKPRKKGCAGSMETADYNAAVQAMGSLPPSAQVVPPPPPKKVTCPPASPSAQAAQTGRAPHVSKAAALARKKAAQASVSSLEPLVAAIEGEVAEAKAKPEPKVKPSFKKAKKQRKKQAYWK